MPRRRIAKPTNIYWLYDTRPEKVAVYGDVGEPFYCGKTIHAPEVRLNAHRFDAHRFDARRFNRPVHSRIRECGEHVRIKLMETVPVGTDWVGREKHWIASLRFLYPNTSNVSAGGQGVPGLVLSTETRLKMSAARKRRESKPHSPETRAKISSAQKGKKRGPHSAETRAKMSTTRRNNPTLWPAHGSALSSEQRAKISRTKTGKKREPFSAEWRARLSVAAQNRSRPKAAEQARICLHCETEFMVSAWRVNEGRGRYCSKPCHYAARRKVVK